jgi:AcrR family transcriptional regulator
MADRPGTHAGRPREFDADEALERATRVFWEQGYDGASLANLTEAMGITRTSMYAAFGNKDDLFRRALERYTDSAAEYSARTMEQPTAREVATAFLAGAVNNSTRPGYPTGCLGVQGALAAGATARKARDTLVDWREAGVARLTERFKQAVDERDLPPGTDPALLARYIMTVANGVAVQAATGATRADLQQVADAALGNWPPF